MILSLLSAIMKSDAHWIALLQTAMPALLAQTEAMDLRWTDTIPETPRGYAFETYEEMRERLRRARKRAPTAPLRDALTGAFLYDEENVCFMVSIPIRAVRKGLGIERGDLRVKHKRGTLWVGDSDLEVVEFVKGQLREVLYQWLLAVLTREAARRFAARIHEELVAAVWRPDRVERMLENWGWEGIEAFG